MTRNKIEEGGGTKKKNVHIYIYMLLFFLVPP